MSDAVFLDFEKSLDSLSKKEMKHLLKIILKKIFSPSRNRIARALSNPSPVVDSLVGVCGNVNYSDEQIKSMRLESK